MICVVISLIVDAVIITEMVYIESRYGNQMLLYQGFRFCLKDKNVLKKTFRCNHWDRGCRALISIVEDRVISSNIIHTHHQSRVSSLRRFKPIPIRGDQSGSF